MNASPPAAARKSKRETAEALKIDPVFIRQMVEEFYAAIRGDEQLGPIFAARIADWGEHLDRMTAFWSSVLHESGGFRGNPMATPIALPRIARAATSGMRSCVISLRVGAVGSTSIFPMIYIIYGFDNKTNGGYLVVLSQIVRIDAKMAALFLISAAALYHKYYK